MRYTFLILLIQLLCHFSRVSAQTVSLRTNILLWATTTPNAGVEFAPSRKFTLGMNLAYNAWKLPKDMKLNLYLVEPEVRYWFCRKFEGHFLGVYGQYGHYNIGQISFISSLTDKVLRGEFYGGGLCYGYHQALGDRWGIEYSLGVGYAYMPYEKFRCVDCGERMGKFTRSFIGPTRTGISIHYLIR